MKRRGLLAAVVSAMTLAGCTESGSPSRTETTHAERRSRTRSDRPETSERVSTDPGPETDDCEWPDMCAGTRIVEVTVAEDFSGEVVLDPTCRDGTETVLPGETVTTTRETDAESCDVRLLVDGETVFDRTVSGSSTYVLTVDADGSLETSMIVL